MQVHGLARLGWLQGHPLAGPPRRQESAEQGHSSRSKSHPRGQDLSSTMCPVALNYHWAINTFLLQGRPEVKPQRGKRASTTDTDGCAAGEKHGLPPFPLPSPNLLPLWLLGLKHKPHRQEAQAKLLKHEVMPNSQINLKLAKLGFSVFLYSFPASPVFPLPPNTWLNCHNFFPLKKFEAKEKQKLFSPIYATKCKNKDEDIWFSFCYTKKVWPL